MNRMSPLAAAILGGLVASCGGSDELPGDELMGRFNFEAARADPDATSGVDCKYDLPGSPDEIAKFPEVEAMLEGYELTFSRNGPEEVFITAGGRSRPATFDGQFLESTLDAERSFAGCLCELTSSPTRLVETFRVALLSQSQNEALGDACPPDAFASGAIPAPGSAPGIVGPDSTPGGFDAKRACGDLIDTIVPGDECQCSTCAIRYPAVGVR